MSEIDDVLWARLQEVLNNFSTRLSTLDSELRSSVVRLKNEAFLLRGYLALQKEMNDEVAIFIDMQCDQTEILIESDISMEDGFIIADGPSLNVPICAELDLELELWIKSFGEFLDSNEKLIRSAIEGGVPRPL